MSNSIRHMLRGLDAFDDRALVCFMGDNVRRRGYTNIRNFKVAARRELGDQCISGKRSDSYHTSAGIATKGSELGVSWAISASVLKDPTPTIRLQGSQQKDLSSA